MPKDTQGAGPARCAGPARPLRTGRFFAALQQAGKRAGSSGPFSGETEVLQFSDWLPAEPWALRLYRRNEPPPKGRPVHATKAESIYGVAVPHTFTVIVGLVGSFDVNVIVAEVGPGAVGVA